MLFFLFLILLLRALVQPKRTEEVLARMRSSESESVARGLDAAIDMLTYISYYNDNAAEATEPADGGVSAVAPRLTIALFAELNVWVTFYCRWQIEVFSPWKEHGAAIAGRREVLGVLKVGHTVALQAIESCEHALLRGRIEFDNLLSSPISHETALHRPDMKSIFDELVEQAVRCIGTCAPVVF